MWHGCDPDILPSARCASPVVIGARNMERDVKLVSKTPAHVLAEFRVTRIRTLAHERQRGLPQCYIALREDCAQFFESFEGVEFAARTVSPVVVAKTKINGCAERENSAYRSLTTESPQKGPVV